MIAEAATEFPRGTISLSEPDAAANAPMIINAQADTTPNTPDPSGSLSFTSRFTIPARDLDLFANDLNARARKLVKRRLRAMAIIHRAPRSFAACEAIAATFHMERGWSAKSLHRLYTSFIDAGGDWRALVDAAIAGPAWQNQITPSGLPTPFLDFLAREWAQKQRGKFASVYSKLLIRLERWRNGDSSQAIPGYSEPPAAGSSCGSDLPAGWTYSNLSRAVKPRVSKFALSLVRIGPKAASQLGPQTLATREGLAVGRYLLIDDSWNDFKVIAFGQACRLLSFHILDLFSACNLARGYKPALKDEREVEQRLKEREVIWLLTKALTTDGYHPAGCTIICEKSTATVRERERAILADCGIPIKVEDGPAGGGTGIAGLFTGPGGGNPRWKAPLESWFNLLRNRTDDLLEFPGQTGSNSRLNMPEGLPGLEKDSLALIRAFKALGARNTGSGSLSASGGEGRVAFPKAELLRLGLLPYHEAIFALDAITEVINCRTGHDLEGWKKCGHYIQEFRLRAGTNGPTGTLWQPMASLLDYAPDEREAIAALLKNDTKRSLVRERALSPREVYDAGKPHLVKLPMAVAALLMDDLPGVEAIVKNCRLQLSCPDVDPVEPLIFGLARRDGRGTQTPLRNDEKFFVRVNPLDPRLAWLYTADGKFAGVAPYYGRPQRDDPAAITRAHAAKRQALAPLIEEGRRLAANLTADATDRAAANAILLGPTPAQQARVIEDAATAEAARENLRKSANMF